MLTTSERYSDSSSYKAGYWNVTDEMRKDSQHRSTQHAVNTTVTLRTGHNRVTCTGFKSSHEPASYCHIGALYSVGFVPVSVGFVSSEVRYVNVRLCYTAAS